MSVTTCIREKDLWQADAAACLRQLLPFLQALSELVDVKRTKKSGRPGIAVRLREEA
jgi:hypothetical protein